MGLFSKKKEGKKSCCCGGNCTPEMMAQAEAVTVLPALRCLASAAPSAML